MEGGNCIDEVLLSGSNGIIPAFWHTGFLNCKFLRDDSENTDQAFKQIEAKLSYIKKESKNDHIDLRDCLIGYFKGNTTFNFDDLVETLTEKFTPEKQDLDLNGLKEKLLKLKKQDKFDGTFSIDKKKVRDRAKRRYPLGNDVILLTTSGTKNIGQTEKNNKKYVVIESENIPADFKKVDL